MAVNNAMFLFEVVVDSVQSNVASRQLMLKSDFADIFSLELKDPKQMQIVIPEPPPLPVIEPKKGKKKKPKPKGKKGKKGKKPPPPPPEPLIQAGQSVLFTSSAEILLQNMKKFPMEISLWAGEEELVCIGNTLIPWDPSFESYLQKIYDGQSSPAVTVKDDYNIFEEGTAKLLVKIGLQVKLSCLNDKVTTAFRTLTEDPGNKKYLYTGVNSKITSYMCTLKTTDEDFEANCNKIENKFTKAKINYANFKNAPGANLTDFFQDGDYCCMRKADKPPDSKYEVPETAPDIDFIVDYIRKVIVSCNDNLRMLTPRPTIRPRAKATDIDKLCYCQETEWPQGKLAERFKKEVLSEPCPICINAGKKPEGTRPYTFDIENIRGLCGRTDCRIARYLREYIENLIEEDNREIDINEIIGPCGSKDCTLAEKIQKFIRHEAEFQHGTTTEALSTQCDCLNIMRDSLQNKKSCKSICSTECDYECESDENNCVGDDCSFNIPKKPPVHDVYYFTVQYDEDLKTEPPASQKTTDSPTPATSNPSGVSSHSQAIRSETAIPTKFKYCSSDCPSVKTSENLLCSKSTCSSLKKHITYDPSCKDLACRSKVQTEPSPADSKIVIDFDDIRNPCCVKTCEVADKIKEFIADNVISKKPKSDEQKDLCYCDCECDFHFTKKTTYCAVCGGFECLGDDMRDQPIYARPHPCPVYNKLYNKKYIKVHELGPVDNSREETQDKKQIEKSTKSASKSTEDKKSSVMPPPSAAKSKKEDLISSGKKKETKKVGKFTANVGKKPPTTPPALPITPPPQKKRKPRRKLKFVPQCMGWQWDAIDIPGLEFRPLWKPGAAKKALVKKYRTLLNGSDVAAKKKRAQMQKKKKLEMKPTLIVKKVAGEYTVQMEVYKKYSKERLLHQYPFEEKPPLIYTIGKTQEEVRKIQAKKDRKERRENRRKNRLLQSTFRDRCQEICVKAYNQAIGLLPLPDPNNPNCPCDTKPVYSPLIDSCSCSDEDISSSDTDDDEWMIEFYPPASKWNPKAKHPPAMVNDESQYTYLDYKVKLLDKQGNPVPRYFIGPDGKEECSDLGGFWGPEHVWNVINKDGYIGPDNRWVPMNFIGPDGSSYSAEEGFFIDNIGQRLKIGVDGYIDKDCKWVYYRKKDVKCSKSKSTYSANTTKSDTTGKDKLVKVEMEHKRTHDAPSATHETKVKLDTIISKTPTTKKTVPSETAKPSKTILSKRNNPMVMNFETKYAKDKGRIMDHAPKMDPKKLDRYREIMEGLETYQSLVELKGPVKTNRACNTSKEKLKTPGNKNLYSSHVLRFGNHYLQQSTKCRKEVNKM